MTGPATDLVPGVMGRGAAALSSVLVGVAGLVALAGSNVSQAMTRLGPTVVDTAWSSALILGGLLAAGSLLAARRFDEDIAVAVERAGACCTLGGLFGYAVALVSALGLDGNLMALALTFPNVF